MFAIIETGGKQYKVNEGDIIFVEKLDTAEGETISLTRFSQYLQQTDSSPASPQ
jgi:large subunit ribosomal protein L21